jgi:REP element-mobilizing transposase RayT
MPDRPLAYLITFSTYGTWLHGEARGSVDDEHNVFDTPWLPPDPEQYRADRAKMTQDVYQLDAARRVVVCQAIVEECQFRQWVMLAAHVRSNHVHLVVRTDASPESVMTKCKAHASRRLNLAGFDRPDRKRWTAHGSTRYLWRADAVAAAVDYVLNRQGEEIMERYEGAWREFLNGLG